MTARGVASGLNQSRAIAVCSALTAPSPVPQSRRAGAAINRRHCSAAEGILKSAAPAVNWGHQRAARAICPVCTENLIRID